MNRDDFIVGGYRSTHARSKTFASAELAEQFDYGVRSFKWGQDRPATAAQRAGWDWAELMDEKGRARFERFRDGGEA